MATKFGRKNPDLKVIIAGVKFHARVNRSQPEVKLLRNALWPPNLLGRNPDLKGTNQVTLSIDFLYKFMFLLAALSREKNRFAYINLV